MIDEPDAKTAQPNPEQALNVRIEGRLFVDKRPESEDAAETSHQPEHNSRNDVWYRRFWRLVWQNPNAGITALSTLAIAAFTIALTCVSTCQWHTTQQQLSLEERPWLSAEVKILGPLTFDATGDGQMLVFIKITNSGHSPAAYVFDETRFIPMGVKRDQADNGKQWFATKEADRICETLKKQVENPFNRATRSGYTLFPNRSIERIQPLQLHKSDIDEALAYSVPFQGNEKRVMPMIIGCIDYGFVFTPERHQTQFCWDVGQIFKEQPLFSKSIEIQGTVPLDELRLTYHPPNTAN